MAQAKHLTFISQTSQPQEYQPYTQHSDKATTRHHLSQQQYNSNSCNKHLEIII
jgi:hypothetical protein